MKREVKEYRKPGNAGYPEVRVVDVRDICHGDYSVEKLVEERCGYEAVFMHHDLSRCIEKAEKIFASM